MRTVQEDMKNSMRVLFKEDDVPSPRSNPTYEANNPNGEEPRTPTPLRPLVGDEWGSSNHKYLDANLTWSAQDNVPAAEVDIGDGGEESDNNATARPSTDDDRSDIGAPTQESHGNRVDPSHNDGVEPESIPIPTTEKHHFILCNGTYVHQSTLVVFCFTRFVKFIVISLSIILQTHLI